jgi:hypothetical protein
VPGAGAVKTFRRCIEPFGERATIDVVVAEVLNDGPGYDPAPDYYAAPLADTIDNGDVVLRVLSMPHVVPQEELELLDDDRFLANFSGRTRKHRELCLSIAYALNKKARVDGASGCAYSGGWADVCAEDGSLFVECGTLNPAKPLRAAEAGDALLIIPYLTGGRIDAATAALLDPLDLFSPKRREEYSRSALGLRVNEFIALSRVTLGFLLTPTRSRRRRAP